MMFLILILMVLFLIELAWLVRSSSSGCYYKEGEDLVPATERVCVFRHQ